MRKLKMKVECGTVNYLPPIDASFPELFLSHEGKVYQQFRYLHVA